MELDIEFMNQMLFSSSVLFGNVLLWLYRGYPKTLALVFVGNIMCVAGKSGYITLEAFGPDICFYPKTDYDGALIYLLPCFMCAHWLPPDLVSPSSCFFVSLSVLLTLFLVLPPLLVQFPQRWHWIGVNKQNVLKRKRFCQ